MSDLQKELVNMIILFDNETLLSVKPMLEKILDEELLKIDKNANIKEMDLYDKIDVLRAKKILENKEPTTSLEDILKELNIGGDASWNTK